MSDHKPLIGKTGSGVPRLLVDLVSEDENNSHVNENFFAEAILPPPSEPKISPYRSYLLNPYENCDECNETSTFAGVLAQSPEISRRESHSFSPSEENFTTNVPSIVSLAISPNATTHPAELSPTSPFDQNFHLLVHEIPIKDEFLEQSKFKPDDPKLEDSSSHDADTEDERSLSPQFVRKFAPFSSFQSSNTNFPVVGLTTTRDALPTPHPKKKISIYKLAASVETLKFEENRVLIPSQDLIVAESTDGRSKSTTDVRVSKASITTRSTPDLGNAVRSKYPKPIPSYPKPDYSKVQSKVRQYKKALAALSKKPLVPEPTFVPTKSFTSSDPKSSSTRTTYQKSSSTSDVSVPVSGVIRSSMSIVAHSSSCLKSTPTTIVGTQTLPETYSEAKWISQSSRNSQYDPVGEYIQDLWDILDLTTKEKRMYEEAYRISDKTVKRLELEAAHVRQMVEKAIRSRRLSREKCDDNDAVCTPKRKNSSFSSSSGWITSSSSGSLLHSGPQVKEAVYTGLGHEDAFSRERSTFKSEIHSSSAGDSAQAIRQRGTSMASSQGVKPSVVMGVRHKMALAESASTRRKETFDEEELEKLSAFAFAPLAGHRKKKTQEDDKVAAIVVIDPREDLMKPASKMLVETEDEGKWPRHTDKVMWSAGFFLNKTATAIVPEVQQSLNLCNPKSFFSFRKLTSKSRKRNKSSVSQFSVSSSISSTASSQTSLSLRLRAKLFPPSIASKNRRRSKSCERLQ